MVADRGSIQTADWLIGGGRTGERIRSMDWSESPLGPRETWPPTLRTALGICLNSRFPMFVWWGPDRINLYNDAYVPYLGHRHPEALGRPAQWAWNDIWPIVGRQADDIFAGGDATWNERVLLTMERYGFVEDTWFTWSYSPIHDESGRVAGMYCACTEETQRVLAEQERDRLAEQRQIALDAAAMGWWHYDPATNAATYDRRFAEIFGVERRNLSMEELLERLHPDDANRSWQNFQAALGRSAPEAYSDEYRIVLDDGSVRWIESHGRATSQGAGADLRATSFVGTVADITARKRDEEVLRATQQRLRSAETAANLGLWELDLATGQAFWSEGLYQLLGFPSNSSAPTINSWAQYMYPEDRDRILEQFSRDIAANADDVYYEFRIIRTDGAVRWLSSTGQIIADEAGKPVRAFGGNQDITERKRAEERISRLYSVAAALSETITTADVARVTVDQGVAAIGANAGSLALLSGNGKDLEIVGTVGYSPEVIGRWKRMPLDADVPLAEAVRRGEPIFIESPDERLARYPALAPLDAIDQTKASACIPLTIGGRVVGSLGLSFGFPGKFTASDREFMLSLCRQCAQALDRARLFEAERQARAEAERAGRTKDEFLATLSHELRTPLNAILGWSQILAAGTKDEEDLAEGLRTIERNARAQTQIIEDLLDMSRIISGKVRLDVKRVDLASVLREAVETTRPAAEVKGVRLAVELDPSARPIFGDSGRLQQVFWNLLSNAVKFTPRDGRVVLKMQQIGSQIEASVTDTGEGISPEFLPHVFDRFRQADASTTRRHGGLGLGLAIVKQLVEVHGGSVRVTSEGKGRGATFTVTLPILAADANPRPSPDDRVPHASAGLAAEPIDCGGLGGLRILVVDDEPDARVLLKRLLEDCGASVTIAASAEEAFRLLRENRPDVLVSDIGMPGEDGHSLVRRVRALPPEEGGRTPAVALTAYARAEDRASAIRAGFQNHVVKPVALSELVAVLASITREPG